MKAEKIIRLRMQNSTFCRRIPVVQGDTARTFRFILEDITLDGTEHARIYARKPSGAEVYDECEVVGSNEVIFTPETEQIFIETGIILAEIRVAKGEKLITSYSFEFEVRQSTMRTGDIPSSDEFNALERAIEEAKGLHEPEFTEAGKRENIVSGETMQILFGKIKKWLTDLGALITKIGNTDISSIGDGTVTGAITDLDKRSTKNTSDIDVERKRIDNIAKLPEGSTAGDAELADIRVAADGTSYDTAGESVRGQINQIDQKYEKETSSLKEDLDYYGNILNDNIIRKIKWEQGSLYSADGTENDNMKDTRIRSDFIESKDSVGNVFMSDKNAQVVAFIYDESKAFVRATDNLLDTNFTIDGTYIRFVMLIKGDLPITISDADKCVFSYPKIKSMKDRVTDLEDRVTDKLKYVAFGDSLTIGRRSDDWKLQTDRAYPSIFGKYFNYEVVNLGVGGQGLTYNDTSKPINLAYDDVVAHHDDIVDADLITFKWGNNDRGGGNLNGCVSAYQQIFDYVKSVNPYTRIIVISPNNTCTSGTAEKGYWYNGDGKFTLSEFNNAISSVCDSYGIQYIDINNWCQISALPDYLGDNVHPKDEAFEKYHRYVAFAISSVIGKENNFKFSKIGKTPVITFIDDDTSTQATVRRYHDICETLGIKGTFAVITSHIESDTTLKNMLLSYEDEGFGMLYHCYSQESYWGWTSAYNLKSCEQNYCKGNRLFKGANFTSGQNMFVSPFGQNKAEIQSMIKRHGAECLLSTDNNVIGPYDNTSNRFNIPRCSLGHNADRYPKFTIEQLKEKIDEAYDTNGWIIVTTHVNEWGSGTSGEDRFTEIVNYAKTKGMKFKTFEEAYEDRKAMFYASELN